MEKIFKFRTRKISVRPAIQSVFFFPAEIPNSKIEKSIIFLRRDLYKCKNLLHFEDLEFKEIVYNKYKSRMFTH